MSSSSKKRRQVKTLEGPANPTTAAGVHVEAYEALEKERTVFFSDAIFAIVATLLVLELKAPEANLPSLARLQALVQSKSYGEISAGIRELDGHLASGLLHMSNSFVAFLISFAVAGGYWMNHHRMFREIRAVDRPSLWFNLVWMFGICLLPFSASLIGGAGGWSRLADAIWASNVAFVSLAAWLLWLYASRAGLLLPNAEAADRTDLFAIRPLVVAGVFVGTAIFALGSPPGALYRLLWLAVPFIPSRLRFKRRTSPPRGRTSR